MSLLGLMGLLAGCGSFPESEPVRGTSATPAERVLTLVEDTQHPGARVGDDDLAGASAATVLEIGTLSVPGRIERAVLVVTPRRVAGEPFARLGALLVEEVELTWGSTPPVPGATRPLAVTDLGLRGVLEALPTTTGEWRIELDPALLGWYRVSLMATKLGVGSFGGRDLSCGRPHGWPLQAVPKRPARWAGSGRPMTTTTRLRPAQGGGSGLSARLQRAARASHRLSWWRCG